MSRGRLRLGLGTQVRAHVERRFSAEFEHPAARVVDYIRCLREVWHTFQTGTRPDYQGRFYRFTLIHDFFNPGPIDHPRIPVDLAGVNERMCRAARRGGGTGFTCTPCTRPPTCATSSVRPSTLAREPGECVWTTWRSRRPASWCAARARPRAPRPSAGCARRSPSTPPTPSYRAVLDFHGLLDIAKPLSRLMRNGEYDAMPALIPDALLEAVAVSGPRSALPGLLRERYPPGLLQTLSIYVPPSERDSDGDWREFIQAFKGMA